MIDEETSIVEQSAIAEQNKQEIIEAKVHIAAYFLFLGDKLKENRDKSLWKLLGCDSFEDFLGSPEISFGRSKAYDLIRIRELYKDKLGIDDRTLIGIGHTNLLMIAPVVESDKEGWLAKAEQLSKSDLKISVAEAVGKAVKSSPPASTSLPRPSSCVNGCAGDAEKGHFPITRGAGGNEVEDWWIPMCRRCHTEYHQDPKEWCWKYRKNWARYFYSHINRGE